MDINPMMLLPLLMNKNGGGDMTEMLKMLTSMKGGNPDALLDMLPADEKTKTLLNMIKGFNGTPQPAAETYAKPAEPVAAPQPDLSFSGNEINRALNELLKRK